MNKKPKAHSVKGFGFYGEAHGGGCFDLGTLQLKPGVHLYHDFQLEEMRVAERVYFMPYLLSVLAVLGHPKEDSNVR